MASTRLDLATREVDARSALEHHASAAEEDDEVSFFARRTKKKRLNTAENMLSKL